MCSISLCFRIFFDRDPIYKFSILIHRHFKSKYLDSCVNYIIFYNARQLHIFFIFMLIDSNNGDYFKLRDCKLNGNSNLYFCLKLSLVFYRYVYSVNFNIIFELQCSSSSCIRHHLRFIIILRLQHQFNYFYCDFMLHSLDTCNTVLYYRDINNVNCFCNRFHFSS